MEPERNLKKSAKKRNTKEAQRKRLLDSGSSVAV